jgi:hypothetical protein
MVAYTDPRLLNERRMVRLDPTAGNDRAAIGQYSMVQVGLNYRFGLQSTEDAAQNGDDLRRDPLEVRKTTRARRSYFRDVATGAFIFR